MAPKLVLYKMFLEDFKAKILTGVKPSKEHEWCISTECSVVEE